jgi:N4-gp56 family major capsid protein
MDMAFTTITTMSNLVQAAYDRYVEFSLRSAVTYRQVVDKRPVQQSMPGSSVIFNIYPDMSPVTTPLTETTDPDAVALPNTTNVTVTLAEYGNAVQITRKLRLFSLSDIDPAVADLVAYNLVDSLDRVIMAVAIAGTNFIRENAGKMLIGSGTTAAVASTDVFKSRDARAATAGMRTRAALPREGELYIGYIHPDCSFDLRSETGADGWREPHSFSSATNIWNGCIGSYEGVAWIESPRVHTAVDGAGTTPKATVYRSLVFARQALAEAVAEEPGIRFGPTVDRLMRFKSVGWYGVLGWARYREEALVRIETSSSLSPVQG